ncbi:uncharacterized protein BX663DRAFT_533450 [Cokeromyces recurvatus]|uniref:uncharacterized protein n=1 Tax=Cokeromyces recurvatus TaxID=90255 RepID=UPI002220ACBC|nr:uncharacterized protein BX663DRAFT_533450 [Cokeromyces recurvatus]KAI7898229.1 hypothetical protein BX663DRAFT_533450 [Cokeromyces recurvatus]
MYVRKFEDILEFLFVDTGLTVRDGEGISQSTRRMQVLNDYNIAYGRRIDLLVSGDNNEISSIEFKKRTVSNHVSLYQQSKNMRINSCILSHIHLMTSSTEDTVLYYDFIGRYGYLCQLFEFKGAYVCQKIQDIPIPKCLLELDSFRSSLKNLFAWKEHLVNLSNMISLANYNQEKQYRLVDICSTISPPRSPSRSITPANVYLSPSNANKRTRNIFEHDGEN